jgi:hypothetical protein
VTRALALAVLTVVSLAYSEATAQTKPELRFLTVSGDGRGLYSPAAVFTDTAKIVIQGRLRMPNGCSALHAELRQDRDALVLALGRYRAGEFCARMIVPVRYEAVLTPVIPGTTYRIKVVYQTETGTPSTLADVEAWVP